MPEPAANPKYRPRVAAVTGWTILFFVLLRVAIGWHFLYEGVWKIKSGTFSSTPYLLASVGPLKDVFRSMVDDADGFERMGVVRGQDGEITAISPEYQKRQIDERVKLIKSHYALDADQQNVLDVLAKKKKKELDAMYGVTPRPAAMPLEAMQVENAVRKAAGLPPTTMPASAYAGKAGAVVELPDDDLLTQIIAYDRLLKQAAAEEKSQDPKYLQQRLEFNSTKISGARNAILARVEKPVKDLTPLGAGPIDARARVTPEVLQALRDRDAGREFNAAALALSPPALAALGEGVELTQEQFDKYGPLPMPQATHFPGRQLTNLGMEFKTTTRTEWQDLGMMFGLCAIGACLILGLFTRLAAFGAVVFLAMFYLSMPPWPGVQEVAPLEGHYMIVNKNLIELIACLMIMTSRVGRWLGLDAFFGAIADARRRRRAAVPVVATAQAPTGRVYLPAESRPEVRDTTRV